MPLDPSTVRRATDGFTLTLLGAILGTNAMLWRQMRRRINAIDDVFDEGVQIGYARGHHDGRQGSRPVVVPLDRKAASR